MKSAETSPAATQDPSPLMDDPYAIVVRDAGRATGIAAYSCASSRPIFALSFDWAGLQWLAAS